MIQTNQIVFFGSSSISILVLDELTKADIYPSLIITTPPKPKKRGLALLPSEVKIWADRHNIPTLEPHEIKSEEFISQLQASLFYSQLPTTSPWSLFIVASYGKIIPQTILDIPKHGTLNVHPSLLPKLRGASPIQSAILEDVPINEPHETGVTIMCLDAEMDHGPIVAQEKITIENWPPKASELEKILGTLGGKLLAEIINPWIRGEIKSVPQDHTQASFTKKITKESGYVNLITDDAIEIYKKIRAFNVWPRTYFMTSINKEIKKSIEQENMNTKNGHPVRIIITEAHITDDKLIIDRIIPENKTEVPYLQFLREKAK